MHMAVGPIAFRSMMVNSSCGSLSIFQSALRGCFHIAPLQLSSVRCMSHLSGILWHSLECRAPLTRACNGRTRVSRPVHGTVRATRRAADA